MVRFRERMDQEGLSGLQAIDIRMKETDKKDRKNNTAITEKPEVCCSEEIV
jgi:hypothetical protein